MKKYDIIFADLDGTLIDTISGQTFPKGVWDMRIRFDVLNTIKKLHPQYVFIVSNQGGIENGFVNRAHFVNKLDYICSSIEEYCDCHCDASIGSCNIEYTNLSQIWHDAVEEPKEATDILFVSKNGKVHKVSKIDNSLFDRLKDNDGIDKWVYISDLLPKY